MSKPTGASAFAQRISARLSLSLAVPANPRTRPLIEGRVAPEGMDLAVSVLQPGEIFWRQLKFAEFDVSEMSLSSLLIAHARGDERWVALPVFTTRRFFHTEVLVREGAGIETPADLAGKRVGVTEYQQTAALWTRGVLQDEYGVTPGQMEFWMERTPDLSHGGATGFKAPPGVSVHQIPPERTIASMIAEGALDAVLYHSGQLSLLNRGKVNPRELAGVARLFPDPVAEGIRFFTKTGLHPINHLIVVQRAMVEAHPWVPRNLIDAFERANAIADRERLEHVRYHLDTGALPREAEAALARRATPYGFAANRAVLETAARYSFEQGLTPEQIDVRRLFAPATLDS